MKKYILLVLVTIFISSKSLASDPRIEGIANYMADLSEKNFAYVIEQKLLKNGLLQCYFPTVHGAVKTVGLLNAVNFNPSAWETYFLTDLEKFFSVALLQSVDSTLVKQKLDVAREVYIEEFMQKLEIDLPDSGVRTKLSDPMQLDWSTQDKQTYNKYWVSMAEYFEGLNKVAEYSQLVSDFGCNTAQDIPKVTSLIAELQKLGSDFTKAISAFGTDDLYYEGVAINPQNIALGLTAFGVIRLTGLTDKDIKDLEAIVNSESLEVQIVLVFQKIESLNPHLANDRGYSTFKDFVLLSAKLAEADESETVENALNGFFYNDVSFGVKREFNSVATIQSYFNGSYDSALEIIVPSIPIGLEWSKNVNGSPIGIMVGIVDFAGPTIAVLEDQSTEDFKWSELYSPMLQVSLGLKELPLAASISYQFDSKTIRAGFGLDMPLFNLVK